MTGVSASGKTIYIAHPDLGGNLVLSRKIYLAEDPTPLRCSSRLATKPAVNYYEAAMPSEAAIRRRDLAKEERAAARAQDRMIRNALRVKVRCQMAIVRHEKAMKRRTERIIARMERDAAVLAAMPATPPRLARQAAVTGEAPWAPPHGPALSRTEATGCDLPPLPNWTMFEPASLMPPPPLRRVCASPDCDEDCKRCRYNDRLAEFNRSRPLPVGLLPPPAPLRRMCASPDCDEVCRRCRGNDLLAEFNREHPLPVGPASVPNLFSLPPPPIGATVVRIPIDMRLMTNEALRAIVAAANAALGDR
jgi:hypothetical protein